MVSFNGIFLNKELMFIPPVFKLRSEMSTTALVFQNSRKFQISGLFRVRTAFTFRQLWSEYSFNKSM